MRMAWPAAQPQRVDRQPDDLHADQLAKLAGILEPGLVAAEVGLRASPRRG